MENIFGTLLGILFVSISTYLSNRGLKDIAHPLNSLPKKKIHVGKGFRIFRAVSIAFFFLVAFLPSSFQSPVIIEWTITNILNVIIASISLLIFIFTKRYALATYVLSVFSISSIFVFLLTLNQYPFGETDWAVDLSLILWALASTGALMALGLSFENEYGTISEEKEMEGD